MIKQRDGEIRGTRLIADVIIIIQNPFLLNSSNYGNRFPILRLLIIKVSTAST